jgi:hypothetical protein
MKKSSIVIISALTVVVAVVVGLAVRYMPSVVPDWQCGEVYQRYKGMEGIRASYVKDFRVNDTLTVGVTLLEAEDSAAWDELVKKFNVPDDAIEATKSSSGEIKVWIRLGRKGHPEDVIEDVGGSVDMDKWEFDMIAESFEQRTICIFDINSMDEYLALVSYSVDIMANKIKVNFKNLGNE